MTHSHVPPGPAAFVSEGRWLVHCVNLVDGCMVAREIVKPPKTHPLTLLRHEEWVCESCSVRNPPTTFPKSWKAIEKVLMARPVPQTRNWYPFESVGDLERENVDHGVPV